MSNYIEQNSLAKYWNRDNTRLEWAKWVYYHPEQTQQLVDMLLQETDIRRLNNRLNAIEAEHSVIEREIVMLEKYIENQQMALYPAMSDEDIDQITGVNLNGE